MMTDPMTAAAIATLALSKFAESGASEVAKKLIENLWGAIAARFKGREKAEAAIKQLEASQGKAPEAEANLVRVLDAEMFEDEAFAGQVQQMAQQIKIIQIQNQSQTQGSNQFDIDAKDNARVNAVGEVNATTVNFGDRK